MFGCWTMIKWSVGVPKYVVVAVAAMLTRVGPNALSIRPTNFVIGETRTHNLRILKLTLY